MNLLGNPQTLDPALAVDAESLAVLRSLFPSLTAFNHQEGQVSPHLAASWEVSPRGLVYTFHLRDDLYWVRYNSTTGTVEKARPVTAYDVEYGIRRAVMPEYTPQWRVYNSFIYVIYNASSISGTDLETQTYDIEELGVYALDESTLRIELGYAVPYFPVIASSWATSPLPAEVVEEFGEQWTAPDHILTCGPYALKEWKPGDSLSLVKNPYYFNADQVDADFVHFSVISDTETLLSLYREGELDTVSLLGEATEEVQADAELEQDLAMAPHDCSTFCYFTWDKPPFDDVHVRRAFSLAVDRESLITQVVEGRGVVAHTFAPPGIFGSPAGDPETGIFYDLDAAKSELAEAGYTDSANFPPVRLAYMRNVWHAQASAEVLSDLWAEAMGIRVQVEEAQDMRPEKDTPLEELPHIWCRSWCADYPDEDNWVYEMFDPGFRDLARMDPDDPDVRRFAETVEAAHQQQDLRLRRTTYQEAEHILVSELAVVIPLFHPAKPVLTKPYLTRNYPSWGGLDIENWRVEPH